MRGTKAKRLRKLAKEFEPQKFKHGQRLYYFNQHTGALMCGGHRAVYQTFKRYYKKLRREDYVEEIVQANKEKVL